MNRKYTVVRKVVLGLSAVAITGALLPLGTVPAGAATTPRAGAFVLPQQAAAKYKFTNCTALNKVYKHGVGSNGAKDKTSGKRVTNFTRSTALYKKIVGYKKSLDRDKDGIACEKR